MKAWIKHSLIVVGLLILTLTIWFGGPLLAFGDVQPLGSVLSRVLTVGIIILVVLLVYGIGFWKKRKAAKALEDALTESEENEGDAEILSEKMTEAIDVLKKSSGNKNYLYELPWYVIIGPPGSGKTTALVNSGLKFPLAGKENAASVMGVGGTRYCDWWFTDDAVMIDTAGRYTTQDSDADADKASWLSFLQLLKHNRLKQPINGVIIAISLEDLIKGDKEALSLHATEIRKRLVEIHQELKIDFPVYALFTKADLVAGFMEFFGNFNETRRRQVWGATFQSEKRNENPIGQVEEEFNLLLKVLADNVTDRLQEEPDGETRISIFGFPAQVAHLREKVIGFLSEIFEPTRYHVNANLRGFYFSSGTQEGTPIDQVLGAMASSFSRDLQSWQMSGKGRSFFIHDLFKKVIFEESGWVSFDRKAVRRASFFRYSAIAALIACTVGLAGLWTWSYFNNRSLISVTENSIATYRVNAREELTATVVKDDDLLSISGYLQMLRKMPVGYEYREDGTPMKEGFGLSQRPQLVVASEVAYRQGLERMFRSRLILRLERQLELFISDDDPLSVYEALKVYLMLGGKARSVNKQLIISWMKADWANNQYPGPDNKAARQELLDHLEAMLDLDAARSPSFQLDGPLVEAAQKTLARMHLVDQAYALIKSASYTSGLEDFYPAQRAGAQADTVFETVDGSDFSAMKIPMIYTYRGFHEFFLVQLSAVAEKLEQERWVLGEFGQDESYKEQYKQLGPQLLDRYGKDFVEVWTKMLANIRLRPMSADKPKYINLSTASSPSSPIRELFKAVAEETALTKDADTEAGAAALTGTSDKALAGDAAKMVLERARMRMSGLANIGIDLALKKSQSRVGGLLNGGSNAARRIPGANIEAQFREYQMLFDGKIGVRPIDGLIQVLYETHRNLVLAATVSGEAERAAAMVQRQVATLRASASRLPRPLARMIQGAVEDFEGDAADTSIAQLNQLLQSTVTRRCQQIIANRYPFKSNSRRDVQMQDFATLFSPNGILDQFFSQNLSKYVDMSGTNWKWKQDSRMGQEMSSETLRHFQNAQEIRDAFFPQGGRMPGVNITIKQTALQGQVESALLTVNQQILQTQQVGNMPMTINWPGSMSSGSFSIQFLPEMFGRTSSFALEGSWALMRAIKMGSPKKRGDTIQVHYNIGGRYVQYDIQVGSILNPFMLRALSRFQCPEGL
nr:type VI secretion system membrane subunit TssM [uncultured Cohaesibacter sp.]